MGILLFNWSGYRWLTFYWEKQENTLLEAQLDGNNYDESQLIPIKIPSTHLSSYSNTRSFERVNGQVAIRGIQYKYVKRRIFNDSLEYLCIPNQKAMGLQTARDDFFKLVNDLQQHNPRGGKSGQHPGSSRIFSLEYCAVSEIAGFGGLRYFTINPMPADRPSPTRNCYSLTAEQRPDFPS